MRTIKKVQQPRVVYLHGFNSSPASHKARLFLEYCQQHAIDGVVPALPYDPALAIQLAEAVVTRGERPALLIGSSLGGYYATWLAERHGLRAALINPAVSPHATLGREFLGPQTNYHTGETYTFTEVHVAALAMLDVPSLHHPANYLLLVETGDEVLDYRLAVERYRGATQIITAGGSHSYDGFIGQLPRMMAFAGLTHE